MTEQKYSKYINRFKDLIKEFKEQIDTRKTYNHIIAGYTCDEEDYGLIQGWFMKCESLINLLFGLESPQYNRFIHVRENKEISIYQRCLQIRGLLEADLSDLEDGFLVGQEFVIANEVFDSIIEEAKFFIFEQSNKDVGAILLRIVLEDSIKRIARREGIEVEEKKVSILNDELKSKDIFIQTVWRQNQAWLDIGNKAAHGEFEKYSKSQVEGFYNGLVSFISTNFS